MAQPARQPRPLYARVEKVNPLSLSLSLSHSLCVCVLCHDSGRDAGESDSGPGESMQGTVFFSHNELGPELLSLVAAMALMMTSNDSMLS